MVILGKRALKIRIIFTGEHPCRSVTLRYVCSPINFLCIFRKPFPKNISGKLLLQLRQMSSKLQDVRSYALDKKLVVKQPSIPCTKYLMKKRLKQYYLVMIKMHSIPSKEKHYFTILNIYVQNQLRSFKIVTYYQQDYS